METLTRTGAKKPQMTIKMDADLQLSIKSIAKEERRTPHFIMIDALSSYVARKQKRQALLKSMDDAAAHYEATGLHITHEEVKAWAEELKTNRNARLPECHT